MLTDSIPITGVRYKCFFQRSTLVVLECYPASIESNFEPFMYVVSEKPPMCLPPRRHNVSDQKSYTEVYIKQSQQTYIRNLSKAIKRCGQASEHGEKYNSTCSSVNAIGGTHQCGFWISIVPPMALTEAQVELYIFSHRHCELKQGDVGNFSYNLEKITM